MKKYSTIYKNGFQIKHWTICSQQMSRKEKKMEKATAAVMLAVFMIILSGYTIYEYPESTVAVIVVDIIATLQFINNCI